MGHIAGGGKYQRDESGTWRYAATGEPVPGARDMTLSNVHNFRCVRIGDTTYVEVPRGLAACDPDLRWALDYVPLVTPQDPDTGRAVVRVPWAEWQRRDRLVGLWAPELAPQVVPQPEPSCGGNTLGAKNLGHIAGGGNYQRDEAAICSSCRQHMPSVLRLREV